MSTIFAFVTVGSFQRRGAFPQRRAVTRRTSRSQGLYGREQPPEARVPASGPDPHCAASVRPGPGYLGPRPAQSSPITPTSRRTPPPAQSGPFGMSGRCPPSNGGEHLNAPFFSSNRRAKNFEKSGAASLPEGADWQRFLSTSWLNRAAQADLKCGRDN